MSVDIGAEGAKSDPNVVPLCDILLVLLIIFMVITPIAQKGIDVKLPETASDETRNPVPGSTVVLTVEYDESIKVNQEPVAADILLNHLRDLFQTRTNKTVFIRADKTVSYKKVLEVIDAAKGAGVEVLGVYTTQYESPR